MLTAIVLLPSIGAIAMLLHRRWSPQPAIARRLALVLAAATAALALGTWVHLETGSEGAIVERWAWMAWHGQHVELAVDRLGLLFLLPATVIAVAAVLLHEIDGSTRSHVTLAGILAIDGAAALLFTAGDLVSFVAAWELIAFIAGGLVAAGDRGDGRSIAAARRMVIVLFAGSAGLILAAARLVAAHQVATGTWSYSLAALAAIDRAPAVQSWIAVALLAAWLVRIPVVPFHGWLPAVLSVARPPAALLVVTLLVISGLYGCLRFVSLVPDATTTFAPFLLWAGVLSMVHAGCAALLQLDGRRLVGWLAMAGGAFALAGFAAGVSAEGRAPAGAVAWFVVAHAAACAMLLAVVAAFEARRGPMRLGAMGGVGRAMPLWAVAAVVAALAVIAAPATAGFPAQLELLAGIAGAPVAGRGWLMAIVVVALAAWPVALARPLLAACGLPPIDRNRGLRDLDGSERAAVALLGGAILLVGLAALASLLPHRAMPRIGGSGVTVEVPAGEGER